MKTRYYLSGVIALFFSISLVGQEGSDAVFESIRKEFVLHPDGSLEYHCYKRVKLLTHFSFNRLYGETFIVYHPDYQTLTINKAFTTQQDGKVIHSPENAFNEVLPGFAREAPYYNHLREMVVTHTGLEINSVIELDYTIITKAGYLPALMSDEIVPEDSPVQEKTITVKIPAGEELAYKVYNLRTSPEVKEEEGWTIYTFSFRGISEKPHAPFLPSHETQLPRLVFSTTGISESFGYITGQEAFSYKTEETMKGVVKKAREESKDDLSLVLSLQRIVADELNSYRVPFAYSGYTVRTPVETWKSNGGTTAEKALLLVSLLRQAGINAEPVALIPAPLYNEETGCLDLISDFLVQVNPRETGQHYISPIKTSNHNLIHTLGNYAAIVMNPEKPAGPVSGLPAIENKALLSGELMLDDSLRLSGKLQAVVSGKINPDYDLKRDEKNAGKIIGGGISRSDIEETAVINASEIRSTIDFDIAKKTPPAMFGDYFVLELPMANGGMAGWNMNFLSEARDVPLEIPYPVSEMLDLLILLPSGYEVISPLSEKSGGGDFGGWKLSIAKEGKGIRIHKTFTVSSQTISNSDYNSFKAMVDMFHDKTSRRLLIGKSGSE